MMLQRLNRFAMKASLSSFLVASALSPHCIWAQETFLLIDSGKDRPKQTSASPSVVATQSAKSDEDDAPPLLRILPKSENTSNHLNDSKLFLLGTGFEEKDAVSTVSDSLPVRRTEKPVAADRTPRYDVTTELTMEEFVRRLPLTWQLANASQNPLSPVFLWRGVTKPEPQSDIEAVTERTAGPAAVAEEEPEAMLNLGIDETVETKSSNPVVSEKSQTGKLDESTGSTRNASQPSIDKVPGNGKRPKSVRIPFDSEGAVSTMDGDVEDQPYEPAPIKDFEKLSTTGKISSDADISKSVDSDDQKGQEAPIIDMRSLSNTESEQGADALKASKPNTASKRKIKIDDPTLGQSVPPAGDKMGQLTDPVERNRLSRCQSCLDYYLTHPESTSVRSPWAVMHALLPYAGEYDLMHGNQRVNAVGWMCHNGTCRTQRIFTPTKNGFVPNVGGGVQGHQGQFMAILAQCNVPLDYPIQVGKNKYKVEDLVRYEMATCKEKSELTFKLIGLSYYLDSDKQWKANDGKVWSIQKLIQEELSQPIVGAACGGTHRLMGYSFAIKQRLLQGQPLSGQYAKADKFVNDYIAYTWKLQNPDGSFSTSWYERRGDEPNEERKVQTTGHMLEWLMFTIPDSELNQPRVQKSIDFLLSKIYDKKDYKWPIGPRGHATRAIALYSGRYEEIREHKPELLQPIRNVAAPRNPAPFSRK